MESPASEARIDDSDCLQVSEVPHSEQPGIAVAFLTLLACVGVGVVAPLIYARTVYGAVPWQLEGLIQHHIILISGANVLCLLFAALARGQLQHKIQKALTFTVIIYGLLAFTVMAARLYFSRPAMSASFCASLVLVFTTIAILHRTRGTRVAALGPASTLCTAGQTSVIDPAADVSHFDVVLVDFSSGLSPEWAEAASRAALAGCEVRDVRHYAEEAQGKVSISEFAVAHVSGARLASYRLSKRALDLLLVMAIAPIAAPLLVGGMLAIVVTMGRPIFFVQSRVGMGGKPFRMWKLRTMRKQLTGAAPSATISGDSRITPLGALLRRFRIDELPQLFNVVRGDMSLIGPRPEQPLLAATYAGQLTGYIYRHLVRPGITGWAQVRAGYAADVHETRVKLGYDLYYVKNFSLALDLEIAARTVWTLVSGSGVR